MPPPRLRLLYAGQMLDGRVLQVFPKRCPPPRPGTGAVFVRPRPRAGAAALRLLRKALPTGRQAGLLLGGLCHGGKAQAAARIYAPQAGWRVDIWLLKNPDKSRLPSPGTEGGNTISRPAPVLGRKS